MKTLLYIDIHLYCSHFLLFSNEKHRFFTAFVHHTHIELKFFGIVKICKNRVFSGHLKTSARRKLTRPDKYKRSRRRDKV